MSNNRNNMFSIKTINESSIKIIENGNIHAIDMKLKYWDELSINLQWLYASYDLLDRYCVRYLFLGMIKPKSHDSIRAFRAVRTRNRIHFDDILLLSPWTVLDWSPKNLIDAISNNQIIHDYSFNSSDRISEFSITHKELEEWHYSLSENTADDPNRFILFSNYKDV